MTQENDPSNQEKILKDIATIKAQINNIETKVDLVLDILNSFTALVDDDEYDGPTEDEDDTPSWMIEQEEDWNSYEDDE